MSVDVERFEKLRRRAVRVRGDHLGGAPAYPAGTYVWAKFGQTGGILLARVISPHAVANHSIDGVRDWFAVQVFNLTALDWRPGETFRRILRALTPAEIADLIEAKVIR